MLVGPARYHLQFLYNPGRGAVKITLTRQLNVLMKFSLAATSARHDILLSRNLALPVGGRMKGCL